MTGLTRLLPLLLPLLLGSCQGSSGGHAIDQPVETAPLPETVPNPDELVGVWMSTQLSGGLDEVARAFVYALRGDGGFTAAVLVDASTDYEWLTLAGEYEYTGGVLDLGPGAPPFSVHKRGALLLLRSDQGNLVLRPFLEKQNPPPVDAAASSSTSDPEGALSS